MPWKLKIIAAWLTVVCILATAILFVAYQLLVLPTVVEDATLRVSVEKIRMTEAGGYYTGYAPGWQKIDPHLEVTGWIENLTDKKLEWDGSLEAIDVQMYNNRCRGWLEPKEKGSFRFFATWSGKVEEGNTVKLKITFNNLQTELKAKVLPGSFPDPKAPKRK